MAREHSDHTGDDDDTTTADGTTPATDLPFE
jgi:hypothetical protein